MASARTAAAPGDALVFRVERIGGPFPLHPSVPSYSVYADGRLIADGPIPAISPPPALPNVVLTRLAPEQVRELLEKALAAGLNGTTDLGTPRRAVAVTTRFTLATADGTCVREVTALPDPFAPTGTHHPGDGLTEHQRTRRAALAGLVGLLEEFQQHAFRSATPHEPYEPTALAVLARPWVGPQDGRSQPAVDWPGPLLPGEPVNGSTDLGRSVVTGAQTPVVLAAARSGNAATPWRTADGALWTVFFRPLLPDETGWADLAR